MKISRTLHILSILSFLLPFYYTGCGRYDDNKKTQYDRAQRDSIEDSKNQMPHVDSSTSKSTSLPTSGNSEPETMEEVIKSSSKTERYFIIEPTEDSISGIGMVWISLYFLQFDYSAFFFPLAFLLLLIGIFLKLSKKLKFYRATIFLELAIVLILGIYAFSFVNYILWGYWVCLFLIFSLIIVDILNIRKISKITNP